jgi:hypothetical protein
MFIESIQDLQMICWCLLYPEFQFIQGLVDTDSLEVTFVTKKKWFYKTGDLLKEVQFIWNCLWQDKKRVTF